VQGESISQFFSEGYANLKKKLVGKLRTMIPVNHNGLLTFCLDIALQQYKYIVVHNENFLDADSCGANSGHFWMDLAGGRCMVRLGQNPSFSKTFANRFTQGTCRTYR